MTYQYSSVHCWQNRSFFTSLLQYSSKNMALLVQKFGGGLFLSEFVSGYFKTKKKSFCHLARGEEVGLTP